MAGNVSRGMKRRVALRIGDVGYNAVTENEIYGFLSEAINDILIRQPEETLPGYCGSQTWNTTTTPPLVAGTSDYALPVDFLWDRTLRYSHEDLGGPVWATRVDVSAIQATGVLMPTGTRQRPLYWIWNAQLHLDAGVIDASSEIKLQYVQQVPGYTLGENTSGVDAADFVAETGALSDTVDPLISKMYLPSAEDYAVARCMELRGFYSYAQYLMQQYNLRLQIIAARFRGGDPALVEGRPKL